MIETEYLTLVPVDDEDWELECIPTKATSLNPESWFYLLSTYFLSTSDYQLYSHKTFNQQKNFPRLLTEESRNTLREAMSRAAPHMYCKENSIQENWNYFTIEDRSNTVEMLQLLLKGGIPTRE